MQGLTVEGRPGEGAPLEEYSTTKIIKQWPPETEALLGNHYIYYHHYILLVTIIAIL